MSGGRILKLTKNLTIASVDFQKFALALVKQPVTGEPLRFIQYRRLVIMIDTKK